MRVKLTAIDNLPILGNVKHGRVVTFPEAIDPEEAYIVTDEVERSDPERIRRLVLGLNGVLHRFKVNAPVVIHGELEVEQ